MPFIPKLQFKASLLECEFWDQEILAYVSITYLSFPGGASGKEPTSQCR